MRITLSSVKEEVKRNWT